MRVNFALLPPALAMSTGEPTFPIPTWATATPAGSPRPRRLSLPEVSASQWAKEHYPLNAMTPFPYPVPFHSGAGKPKADVRTFSAQVPKRVPPSRAPTPQPGNAPQEQISSGHVFGISQTSEVPGQPEWPRQQAQTGAQTS